MSRQSRLSRILEIIQEENIETQEQLAAALRRDGYEVTQATVSRDIRQLSLRKVRLSGGRQRYALPADESASLIGKYGRVMQDGIISAEQAQNILVIKTVSGMAMGVAAAVDAMHYPEVVGCIAGDDTIMVAVRTAEDAGKLLLRLDGLQ